jgi:hypothetical protein
MRAAIHLAIPSIQVVKDLAPLWKVKNCVTVITNVALQVNLRQDYVQMVWEHVTIVVMTSALQNILVVKEAVMATP